MSYAILLTLEARHHLSRVGPSLQQYVLRELESLGEHPVALSEPSHFPFREKSQLFKFTREDGDRVWEFYVQFQYGQDEKTILILAIGFASFGTDEFAQM